MPRLLDQLAARYFAQTRVTRGKSAIGRRLRPHLGTVRCRTSSGMLFDADPRDLIQYSVLFCGEWEPEETAVLRDRLRPGDVVYDIGANVGYFTLLAAQLVGPAGHVYAFEPNADVLPKLRHHVQLNGLDNVTILSCALADRDGRAQFHAVRGANPGRSSLRREVDPDATTEVELSRLDTLVAERGLRAPDLVKMDIEGAECLALRGMTETLSRSERLLLLVEVSDRFLGELGSSERELLDLLEASGLALVGEVSRHVRVDEHGRPFQYTGLFGKDLLD